MSAVMLMHLFIIHIHPEQLFIQGLVLAACLLLTYAYDADRLSQRPPGSAADVDEVAQAFKPWLPGILGMAFSTGGRTDQVLPLSDHALTLLPCYVQSNPTD